MSRSPPKTRVPDQARNVCPQAGVADSTRRWPWANPIGWPPCRLTTPSTPSSTATATSLRRATAALSDISAGGQNQIALRAQLLLDQATSVLDGRLADAEALSTEVFEVRRTTGLDETDKTRAIGHLALRREQCRLPELIPALTDDTTGRSPAVGTTAESGHCDGAAILLQKGGHVGFRDIPDDAHWPLAVAMWSEVATHVGDRRAAAALYEILQPHDGRQLSTGGVGCGPVARLLALLETVLGVPHFAEAIAFSRRLQSPVWTARCQLEWAKTWMDRGERNRAAELTDEADATAGMLALPALQRRWEELMSLFDRT